MTFRITHPRKGALLLVKCSTHAHDACWIFASDIPIAERFDKLPVTFTSKKKALKYIAWLVAHDPQYVGTTIQASPQSDEARAERIRKRLSRVWSQ